MFIFETNGLKGVYRQLSAHSTVQKLIVFPEKEWTTNDGLKQSIESQANNQL